jgi:hypothetical protein
MKLLWVDQLQRAFLMKILLPDDFGANHFDLNKF